jgi:transposase
MIAVSSSTITPTQYKGGEERRMVEYVAVDIAKKNCMLCAENEFGTVDESFHYPNTTADATSVAKRLASKYGECEGVVESTGNMWQKTYEAFESCGIKMKLANPLKTRLIAEARIKTDKLDSKILADLLRGDLIAECYVPSKEIRLQRTLLGHRATISREQNRIENRIHALLNKYDLSCPYESRMFGVHGMAWLHSLKLDGYDQRVFESLVRQLEFLKEEEARTNAEIASDAIQNSKYAPKIMSMTGFDYYSASMMSACIADISRFRSPSRLVSWVGMCPTVHQTGETIYYGKMKDGNKKAQWIMTQVANVAAQRDPRMKAYYEKIVKRHHHNVAITHVANKMLRILWYMLTEDTLYNERNERLYASKLKRLQRIAV